MIYRYLVCMLILMAPILAFCQNPADGISGQSPEHLDLYLVIGQSNMAGRAPVRAADEAPVEGAFLYTADPLNPWVQATNPLNRFSTIRKQIDMQRLSPAFSFAEKMAVSEERSIGLVVNARGGSGLVQWLPGMHFFEEAVRLTKEAMAHGRLKGILWHQGESDSSPMRSSWYLERIDVMIHAFREAFDQPNLPFVAGEIAEDRPGRTAFNEILRQLPEVVPHTAVVSSAGASTFDEVHFDAPGQQLLGERYASAMQAILARQSRNSPAIPAAKQNAMVAEEGFRRSYNYLHAWLEERDPETGLIPRNLTDSKDIWNAQDAAADNYPFMVLTAALLDRELFETDMRTMLETEKRLTSRLGHLPDTYSFSRQDFREAQPDLEKIIFGASEYVKDGLLPLTEWLGPSPWSKRMIDILDDIWQYAPVETPYGNIPSTNVEVNGEMLQTLSRIYWMTGQEKYLDWALRLGDYYLLGGHHPTHDREELRLRDHGCEIVSGLCELYFAVAYARKEKKKVYQPAIHEMLDRILETGLNPHGLMWNVVNPQTGEVLQSATADNWGYNYNGFYTVYMIDGVARYRQAIERALGNLHFYRNFDWESGSQDGYADAIEGGLNLYNRLPVQVAQEWLDSEIKVMWSMQDSSHRADTEQYRSGGIIEGWHGDGNFARTSLMYCLWKTKGTYLHPWQPGLTWGAEREGDGLVIYITAKEDWTGTLHFDFLRHREVLHLPADYPRINQFPEWFTVEKGGKYLFQEGTEGDTRIYPGTKLKTGVPVELSSGEEVIIRVLPR